MFQLLYPQICCHCESKTLKNNHFCDFCLSFFELIPLWEFSSDCGLKIASTCDHTGSIKTAVQWLKRGKLTKLIVSLMLMQFEKLGWELPDLIVPIPSRGKSHFIEVFAKKLQRPIYKGLIRKPGLLPQMRLPKKERYLLSYESFILKEEVGSKTILLMDDLIGTGATIRAAARHFYGAKAIYAFTFSRQFL
ncbi:MAG: hypothetical protein S4CHLAM45_04740 [Chlamydiales bacterium]|nr:hypothetical protein [Chlamydiales bacterium]MCH9619985.1 hypothetical protein [Chlamydiales bacterium]MCH9622588.1 hypothetical protein [Chlamydiales bacterium]